MISAPRTAAPSPSWAGASQPRGDEIQQLARNQGALHPFGVQPDGRGRKAPALHGRGRGAGPGCQRPVVLVAADDEHAPRGGRPVQTQAGGVGGQKRGEGEAQRRVVAAGGPRGRGLAQRAVGAKAFLPERVADHHPPASGREARGWVMETEERPGRVAEEKGVHRLAVLTPGTRCREGETERTTNAFTASRRDRNLERTIIAGVAP